MQNALISCGNQALSCKTSKNLYFIIQKSAQAVRKIYSILYGKPEPPVVDYQQSFRD